MLNSKSIRGLETAWIEKRSLGRQTPILLFLHGCPDSPDTWHAQLDHYDARGFTVIAPFARGIGPSAPSRQSERYGLEAIALDHLEILRAVDPSGDRPVVIIAHDIGGIHAWNLARLLGKRLAGLVLLNAPELSQMARRLGQPRQIVKSWYIALFQIPVLPERLLARWEQAVITRAQHKTGMPTQSPAVIAPFIPQYRQAARAIPSALRDKPRSLEAPVLAICSRGDAFLETPTMQEFEELAGDVTVRVIEGNHWAHHHEPARINRLVDLFLEEKIK